ncbi:MAG TPA: endo-1,4-beta-xylanase [Polyangiaceae bacterium]|nr:endo-1,4-beta-xylanase [Polyangiaceae bacterium]
MSGNLLGNTAYTRFVGAACFALGCASGTTERGELPGATQAPTLSETNAEWTDITGWRCRDTKVVTAPSSDADAASSSAAPAATGDTPSTTDAGAEAPLASTDPSGAVNGAPAPKPTAKFVGNIAGGSGPRADFGCFWDQVTPENAGKWGSVEEVRDQMNWAALDRAHDYALLHDVVFKQHTFVWGKQQPTWLDALPAEEQRAEVEEWIRSFCERYPDTALIDVVNEPPPHTLPSYAEALGGAGASGYDWIVQAFKWADQYCPNATLILNDYNNLEYQGDNTHFVDVVKAIRDAGAPLDALGAQAHDIYKLPLATVQANLDALAATGYPIYITEYDLDLLDDATQAKVLKEQFTMLWNDPRVAGITFWGYISGTTWRTNTGMISPAGAPRPSLTWLMDFLQQAAK